MGSIFSKSFPLGFYQYCYTCIIYIFFNTCKWVNYPNPYAVMHPDAETCVIHKPLCKNLRLTVGMRSVMA